MEIINPMLRPIYLDLLDVALPIFIGIGTLICGRVARRASRTIFCGSIAISVAIIAFLGVTYFAPWRETVSDALWHIGGESPLACVAALFMLGVVLGASERSTSTGFLRTLASITVLILVLTTGGRLWWRFVSAAPWHNVPDAAGALTQSTGYTCSPAAATMLLHHYGVATTEGEMAYLAGTSMLGTDARSIAQALTVKGRPHGLTASVESADYASCVDRGPFLACVHIPGLGGHAVFVLRLRRDEIELIDPRFGYRQTLPRAEVEPRWDNKVVLLSKLDEERPGATR